MQNKRIKVTDEQKNLLLSILCCVMMLICVLPCVMYSMAMLLLTFDTVVLTLCVWYVVYLFKIDLSCLGRGLKYFAVCSVAAAIIAQIVVQLRNIGQPFEIWRYVFYYDKPYAVGIVWTIITILPMLFRLFYRGDKDNAEWREKYRAFFKDASTAFIIIYAAIAVFGLYLNRSVYDEIEINFVPFRMMNEYVYSDPRYLYENLFMLIGNIGLFIPLGFYSAIKTKSKFLLFFLPILISGAIEISQLFFKNGHVDIDDFILNVAGFYLGILFKVLFDVVRRKVTHGAEKTIFD